MDIIEFSQQANYMLLGAVNAVKKELRPGHNIQEQDYLTAIVTKFPLLMSGTWDNVKYGGCFIHKSPQVTFRQGGRCEVGDLLVLCRDSTDKNVRYNTALFQLKRVNGAKYKINNNSNEWIQYELYANWPEFSVGGKFHSQSYYNIEPKTVTSGAQYMFINEPNTPICYYWFNEYCFHHPCVFTHSIPSSIMLSRADLSFGRFLWDFIHWQNGRTIDVNIDTTNDEWSRFIWNLIEKTQQKMIKNINSGIQKKDKIFKQQGDFFHFLTTTESMTFMPTSYLEWISDDNVDSNYGRQEEIDEEENGAISMLFIDVVEPFLRA